MRKKHKKKLSLRAAEKNSRPQLKIISPPSPKKNKILALHLSPALTSYTPEKRALKSGNEFCD